MVKNIQHIIIYTSIAIASLLLSGCGQEPDLQYEGKLHFALSGMMGEYGMRESSVINGPPTLEMRISAFFVKNDITYRLNFSDDTNYDGDLLDFNGTIHVDENFPIHSDHTYRIEGVYYPHIDPDQETTHFMPPAEYIYNSNIQTDVKIGQVILDGFGVPADHTPVLVRELYVDKIELVSEGEGASTLHFGIKDNHVFQRNLSISGSDVQGFVTVKGQFNGMIVPDWTQTTNSEALKVIEEEHLQRTRLIFN